MKKLVVTILLLLATTGYANQKWAITDTGEEVILKSDGTWEYSDSAKMTAITIKTNPEEFKKPENASFLLKSTVNDAGFC